MAIDTKSLSQLISEFRKLQTKDSVNPESLGYILQRIADLLATAGTYDTVEKLQRLLDGFKTVPKNLPQRDVARLTRVGAFSTRFILRV